MSILTHEHEFLHLQVGNIVILTATGLVALLSDALDSLNISYLGLLLSVYQGMICLQKDSSVPVIVLRNLRLANLAAFDVANLSILSTIETKLEHSIFTKGLRDVFNSR